MAQLQEYKEKPGACAECGNSPVHHFETYCSSTLSVWSSKMSRRRGSGIFGLLNRMNDVLYGYVEPLFFVLMASFPGARFSHDVTRARTFRSQVIWEEAQRRGIHMEQLVFWGLYTDIYRARVRGENVYFISIPIPPERKRDSAEWMDDKLIVKKILNEAGVRTPTVRSVTTLEAARAAFREIGGAVVVKPQAGSRARHTTVNISNERELDRAFHVAQQLCRYVVVEEYLSGGVSRATVVAGELVGFLYGLPPQVTGDGVRTITELIEEKNANKPERVSDVVLTAEHIKFLRSMDMDAQSVPERGRVVALTHHTGRLFGGSTREMPNEIHPKLRAYVEKAAQTIDTPLVGFDLIVEDPERDPDEQRWGIIEANSLPYIDLHYLPLIGSPTIVAARVWDLWSTSTS